MKSYALRLCTDRTKVDLQDWNLRSRVYKASREYFDVEFRILKVLELRIWRRALKYRSDRILKFTAASL